MPPLAKQSVQSLKWSMPIIKVLPVDVRNKIAAGEVIERPASVVKELIENAIDAGSTEIRVDVLSGGKRMIKVSDNGSGMDKEDARLCFERHATSKLSKESDLFDIRTLGFRGEALPSIASVSKVKLVTGLKGSDTGVALELHGGEVKEDRESAFSGTSVEIRDLFFNTPARKKFLKSTTTEVLHIVDVVTRESLSHSGIHFMLFTEGRETMLLPKASGFRERIMQIYGEEFAGGISEVSAAQEGMRLQAFISKSGSFRNSRSHQFIFVNERPIKDQSITHAVYGAYEGILPNDKHPVFFLFLELDPERVDFNVHPTKREVRFEEKERIYRFVNAHVREAVRSERKDFTGPFLEPSGGPHDGKEEKFQTPYPSYFSPVLSGTTVSEDIELAYKPELPFIYLGDTFIALSGKGGLTLVDHHAAHERVLYERLLRSVGIQPLHLLFPQQVKLSHGEYRVLLENKSLLQELGIELDDFGHDTIVIRSVPHDLGEADLRGTLSDAASVFTGDPRRGMSLKESLAASIACHSSVRGREILTREEVSRLLTDLEQTEHPDQCPHGRPTRIFYSLDDLKKMFKRK
jgi:DNA mismatch repair protein MutL